MAKGKYQDWITPEGLISIEGWARDGLTDAQIADKMGINVSTLYAYQNKYSEIKEAIKKGKIPVDTEVENVLLKRIRGFEYEETITEIYETPNGQQRKHIKKYKKYALPDTTALIFWLKNRRPDKWREKSENDNMDNESVKVIFDV